MLFGEGVLDFLTYIQIHKYSHVPLRHLFGPGEHICISDSVFISFGQGRYPGALWVCFTLYDLLFTCVLCGKKENSHGFNLFFLADEATNQKDCAERDERRNSHVPEQFAGLLHGSSPACESPDNPYQLYGKVRKFSVPEPPLRHGNLLRAPEYPPPFPRTGSEASALKNQREPKPQVVYRTVFHTRVNQAPLTPARNGEARSPSGNAAGFEERACTLGRMRSVPKNVLDLQLSRNFSKSDSNLVAVSPIEEEQWSSRGHISPSKNSPSRLERTPSFTAEWEEVITF